MNIYGKDIMKLLKVDEEMAQKVLTEMEGSGISFSNCSKSEFNTVARLCYDFVKDI